MTSSTNKQTKKETKGYVGLLQKQGEVNNAYTKPRTVTTTITGFVEGLEWLAMTRGKKMTKLQVNLALISSLYSSAVLFVYGQKL